MPAFTRLVVRPAVLLLPLLLGLSGCGLVLETVNRDGGDAARTDGATGDGARIDGGLDGTNGDAASDVLSADGADGNVIDGSSGEASTSDADDVVLDTGGGGDAADVLNAVDASDVPASSDASDASDVIGDVAPSCAVSMQRCYSGPSATAGVGACLPGVQQCIAGVFGPCTGEVIPSAEACNGVDDNCNGTIDEGLPAIQCGIGACARSAPSCVAGVPGTCVAGTPVSEVCGDNIDNNCNGAIDEGCACIHVAPTGSDSTGTGSASAPFRTISHAIATAGTGSLPGIVCVASGATCPSTFDYGETVAMRDGVEVYGGYQAAGSSWPRVSTCVTRIIDQDARGVYFDATVVTPTVIDGFTINGHTEIVNAAISVVGSAGAIVTNDVINGGTGTTSYGILIADAMGTRISFDTIVGGTGTALAIGVYSQRSAPVIRSNCGTLDAMGRCLSGGCTVGVAGIRARPVAATLGAGESYGIRLESSPGTFIDSSGVCGQGMGDSAGIRVSGDATGTVIRASNLFGAGSNTNAVGFWADPCSGAAPWVVNNALIMGNSPIHGARADGVRAVGDCHPVIDSNVRIVGGVESAANDANGVYCARDASTGIASRCTVLNNTLIQGASGGYPPRATGVHCEDGACARIENNLSITGNSGMLSYGIILGATNTFVNANHIEAGCGVTEGDGILAQNSFARIQNNVIGGSLCPAGAVAAGTSYAVQVLMAAGPNEIDLHSNDLLGRGGSGACTSRALAFDVLAGGAPPLGPRGIVRNNIFHPGTCATRYDVIEVTAAADPRIVQNNDFFFFAAGDVLYRDEAATNLTTFAAINGLADITASANLSSDPLWGATNHLTATSPCVDMGIATGAPGTDIDLQSRPNGAGYDIGSDEFH